MKIPKSINIGGFIYDVKLISGEPNNILQERSFVGKICNEKLIITLEKDNNKQAVEQAFFHEVVHGIECNFQLSLDEKDVDRLARGFYQVLNDNNLLKD